MVHPVILLILAIAALLLWSWYKGLPAHRQKPMRNRIMLYGILGIAALGLMTGRLNPILAAIVAAIPMLHRLLSLGNMLKGFGGAGQARSSGQASKVNTRFLHMTLDHQTGEMSGRVIQVRYEGRALGELSLDQLIELLDSYRTADPQSSAVLEAYLEHAYADTWRERAGKSERATQDITTSEMTRHEAREVLGVDKNAKPQDIVSAHRRLMQKLHPDRGGSTYLASKINQAKDVLLNA